MEEKICENKKGKKGRVEAISSITGNIEMAKIFIYMNLENILLFKLPLSSLKKTKG